MKSRCAAFTEAVKELKARDETQKKEIAGLKEQLSRMEEQFAGR